MGFLGTPLGYIMYWIFEVVKNYGWALILFVIISKLVLLPLTIKQQKSTSRMASFQPKLQALQKKYANNKEKYQEEMMKLYEQEGVSPTAGCLPMLVQFALLFGVIDVIYKPLKHLLHIPADLVKQATGFLEKVTASAEIQIIDAIQKGTNADITAVFDAETLTRIKDFNMNFLGIDLGAVPQFGLNLLVLIPIISGVTALLITLISMKQQERNGQKMQGMMKYTMLLMPLMSVWIGFSLPAGVGIYWIVSNLVQIGQSLLLGKIYTPEKLATMKDKNADKNKEKMKKRREKMEAYNQLMIEKGKAPAESTSDLSAKQDKKEMTEAMKDSDKKKLAEARRRMAEKYGEEYKED